MFTKIAGALGQAASQVAEAGGTIVGIRTGTKEPPFTVQRRVGAVEIRRYGARIAAETSVEADEEPARNEGFRRLARYIFSGNTAKATIAMTAPVAQQQGQKIAMTAPVATQRGESGDWVIRFFMPSEHTMDTLPIPNDDPGATRRSAGGKCCGAAVLGRRQPRRGGRKDDRVNGLLAVPELRPPASH